MAFPDIADAPTRNTAAVQPQAAAATPTRADSAPSNGIIGGDSFSDTFLRLLVSQITNQNPLDPQNPGDFVNQLVQITQLETQRDIAAFGEQSLYQLNSSLVTGLSAHIGSRLAVRADAIDVSEATFTGGITLGNATTRTELVLTGDDGTEHRIELGPRDPGAVAIEIDPAAHGITQGHYAVKVETEPKQAVAYEADGVMTEVAVVNGRVVVKVNGVASEVQVGDIVRFRGQPALARRSS